MQNYKLAELLGSKLQHEPKKVIHNYSSYNLSKVEISLLLKGLNFSLPPKKLRFENHLLPFELLYRDVLHDESDINDKRLDINVGLASFRLYNNEDHRFENLSEEEYEAFINLQSNKNIIIQRADKGNSVVVIDHLSYVNEMEKLLSDRSKFVKIEFNPKHKVNQDIRHLLDMEFEIKSCLDYLYNHNHLSKDDYKFLKPCGSNPVLCMDCAKFIKVQLITITYPHSVQFCL